MSKEQKIFFTRHGHYTLWEKLSILPAKSLTTLYLYCLGKKWVSTAPSNTKEYAYFLFRTYEKLSDDDKKIFLNEITAYFNNLKNLPKSDFNGLIYQYTGVYFSDEEILKNLNDLKKEETNFGIEELVIEYFFHSSINTKKKYIDIRFTSNRNDYFKQNRNDTILHTEIRIYFECNMAIVTNFSEYTHSDSQKKNFINEVLRTILKDSENYEPSPLHDHSLRSILLVEKTLPSKLKFEIEGRITIGVDIKDPTDIRQTIEQEEVKALYDKYPISHVKVILSKAENKVLLIDGIEGKLVSRNKTLDIRDIDNFIYQLKDLLKYDYLNMNHTKELFSRARGALITTEPEVEKRIRVCQFEIRNAIKEVFPDDTGVYKTIIENTFYYCLINNISFQSTRTYGAEVVFNSNVESNLKAILQIKPVTFYSLLKNIIGECNTYTHSLKDCLENIDNKIKSSGMIKIDIGA